MVCLAFERLLAVYWPLRAKRFLGVRLTLLLLCIPTFVTALYLVLDVLVYRLFPNVPPLAGSCYGDSTLPSFIYYIAFNEINSISCSTLNISFSFAVAIRCVVYVYGALCTSRLLKSGFSSGAHRHVQYSVHVHCYVIDHFADCCAFDSSGGRCRR